MKTFFKFVLSTLILWVLVGIGVLIFAMKKLPDPQQFKSITKKINEDAKVYNQQALVEEAFKKVDLNKSGVTTIPAVEKKDIGEDIFKTMTAEEFSDIRVCENLGQPSSKIDSNTMLLALVDQKRTDPSVESFRVPLKYVFQSEPVRELLTEIEGLKDLPESEKENFLEKTNFYFKASQKAYEFYQHKKEYEDVADHAFHLYVINQMVLKKPELKNENHIFSFCKSLESAIGSKTSADVDTERESLLKLIAYYGLKPEDLGFNPKVRTKFNFEVKNRSVSFGFQHPGLNI